MKKTIVIADDEPITRMDISEILIEAGYEVVGEATDGLKAVELCRKYKPDLTLLDIKMPKLDGIEAAKLILKEELSDSVVILTAYSDKEFIGQLRDIGVMGYIVKPIDERSLIPSIEIAIIRGKEIKKIKTDIIKAKEETQRIKLIDKAKEALMEKEKLTENDAYKKIRKLSMDKRCSIVQIAEDILKQNRL